MVLLKCCWNCSGYMSPSPSSIFEPPPFFCNAKEYQMVKTILSSIKTVPLVQSGFENKKGPHFIVAKIGQTNFAKSRILQGVEFLSSWNFCFCIIFPKIPNAPILLRKRTVCILEFYLCIQKLCNQFWMFKHLVRGF